MAVTTPNITKVRYNAWMQRDKVWAERGFDIAIYCLWDLKIRYAIIHDSISWVWVEDLGSKAVNSITWKYFVGYHQVVLSQIRDEVCIRCLPNLNQLAKAPLKVKQLLSKAELFAVCKPAMQRAQICLLSVQKRHQISWAEQQQTAPNLVHSGSVCLQAEDRWVSEGRSHKPVFTQNRWLQHPMHAGSAAGLRLPSQRRGCHGYCKAGGLCSNPKPWSWVGSSLLICPTRFSCWTRCKLSK